MTGPVANRGVFMLRQESVVFVKEGLGLLTDVTAKISTNVRMVKDSASKLVSTRTAHTGARAQMVTPSHLETQSDAKTWTSVIWESLAAVRVVRTL